MSYMEIFQSGLKHMREERQRQQFDIAYPAAPGGSDPLVDINLDAGTATILIPARAGHADPVPAAKDDSAAPGTDQLADPESSDQR